MSPTPDQPPFLSLEQLLRRDDIWRGQCRSSGQQRALDTGHPQLNGGLLHGGWPLGALVEICQRPLQGERQLFLPALRAAGPGLVALLNPPAEPFSQALIQAGVDLDRLVVVKATDKASFLACFGELARSGGCGAVLGWQPRDNLSYTELRKCLLAAAEGSGLYAIFRPSPAQRQSSPAPLRLFCQLLPAGLEVTVFKQKGMLQRHQPRPLILPLPEGWQLAPAHSALDRKQGSGGGSDGKAVANLRGSP